MSCVTQQFAQTLSSCTLGSAAPFLSRLGTRNSQSGLTRTQLEHKEDLWASITVQPTSYFTVLDSTRHRKKLDANPNFPKYVGFSDFENIFKIN